jgi:hypothetical protein
MDGSMATGFQSAAPKAGGNGRGAAIGRFSPSTSTMVRGIPAILVVAQSLSDIAFQISAW